MNAATPFALSRAADASLTEQLSARFAERIQQRLLLPGARLPSVRECARQGEGGGGVHSVCWSG